MNVSKLRIARVSMGLTQTDVASLSFNKIPQHRVSALERGMPAKPEEAQALSDFFGLPAAELGVRIEEGDD